MVCGRGRSNGAGGLQGVERVRRGPASLGWQRANSRWATPPPRFARSPSPQSGEETVVLTICLLPMKWGGGPRSGGGVLTQDSSITRAREMRRALTPPEARLWVCLRRRGLGELKFRRQHPVGPYVLVFYCAEATLAVEVDGQGHLENGGHDARRDRWLGRRGSRCCGFRPRRCGSIWMRC